MIASFDRPETSKEIYFALSNSFQLANPLKSPTYKIAGLYALYKGDVCLYVGQSKNVPSRLSTHLTGRYECATRLEVYFVCECVFEGFWSEDKVNQKKILENNENHLINKLKPTENIMVDRGQIKNKDLFLRLFEDNNPDLYVSLDKHSFTVCDDPYNSIDSISKDVRACYKSMLDSCGRSVND